MEYEHKRKRGRQPKLCKRTRAQYDRDVLFCSNLFLRGYTYREIAEELNKVNAENGSNYTITAQAIFIDIKNLLIDWKRERMDNIDDYITQELRKLDKIEVELWCAWEKSKKEKSKSKMRKLSGRNDKVYCTNVEEATETTPGNPKFLDLLLNVQQRRAKMLGFDAPIKIDIPNGNRNEDLPQYDIKSIPDDLLFSVVDKLQDNLKRE
jgi:hypothetical protein